MDPMAVLRTVWRHKAFVFPVLLLTAIAAVYVYQFGPRYYGASTSYAIVNPRVPTEQEMLLDASLANLNSDNPFLRSSDQSLISEVIIARLSSKSVADDLKAQGLSSDYVVARGINMNGFVVTITGNGDSREQAIQTAAALGKELQSNLREIQKVNDADDRFLFTALTVTPLDNATEQFSSRLRSVIMVVLGGAILMFAAVSAGRSFSVMRQNRRRKKEAAEEESADLEAGEQPKQVHQPGSGDVATSTKTTLLQSSMTPGKRKQRPPSGTHRSSRTSSRNQTEEGLRADGRVSR